MNKLIPILTIFFIICIVILQIIQKMFIIPENIILVRIILIGLCLNILIFVYLTYSFSQVKQVRGPAGPQGLRGDKGYEGKSSGCNICGPQPTTYGYEKNQDLKQNLIIPQKPLFSKYELEETTNNYNRLNDIFNNKVGCPNKLVNDEEQANTKLTEIKNNLNKQSLNDDDIQNYLSSIKTRTETGNEQQKRESYPKCYGVEYKVPDSDPEPDTSRSTRVVNPYNKAPSELEINAQRLQNFKCPKNHYLKELNLRIGSILEAVKGKCTDGSIIKGSIPGKNYNDIVGGGGASNREPLNIKNTNALDIYSGTEEWKWAARIGGIGVPGGTVQKGSYGTRPVRLSCRNDEKIVGLNMYHSRGSRIVDSLGIICDKI